MLTKCVQLLNVQYKQYVKFECIVYTIYFNYERPLLLFWFSSLELTDSFVMFDVMTKQAKPTRKLSPPAGHRLPHAQTHFYVFSFEPFSIFILWRSAQFFVLDTICSAHALALIMYAHTHAWIMDRKLFLTFVWSNHYRQQHYHFFLLSIGRARVQQKHTFHFSLQLFHVRFSSPPPLTSLTHTLHLLSSITFFTFQKWLISMTIHTKRNDMCVL